MKLTPYNSSWNGFYIDNDKPEIFTGLYRKEWLRLTGFFENPKLPKHPFKEESMFLTGRYPKVSILSDAPYLAIHFNLKNMTIHNEVILLEKSDQGNSLGLFAHMYQIEVARELRFKSISLTAAGSGGDNDDIFGGYNVWGKLGYTMRPESHKHFLERMKQEGKEFRCLHEIVLDEEHKDYWRKEGETWLGEFELEKNSHNYRLLKLYLFTKDPKNKGNRLVRVKLWMKRLLGRK